MSAKSMFGRFKKPSPPPPPRVLEEINKDYQDTVFKAGQAQYQLYVAKKDLEQQNQKLLRLNQEAFARQELDKKTTPPVETPKTEEGAK